MENAVHPSCDSPNTSWRFALRASNVCRAGDNPTCSAPAKYGCESLRPYDCGRAQTGYTLYNVSAVRLLPSCTADAVKVLVRAVIAIREVVVHHDVHALDIDTAPEQVSGHQDPLFEVLELLVTVCADDGRRGQEGARGLE